MKRQIVLIIALAAGVVAALITRAYLSVKEGELNAERQKLIDANFAPDFLDVTEIFKKVL